MKHTNININLKYKMWHIVPETAIKYSGTCQEIIHKLGLLAEAGNGYNSLVFNGVAGRVI